MPSESTTGARVVVVVVVVDVVDVVLALLEIVVVGAGVVVGVGVALVTRLGDAGDAEMDSPTL